MNSSKLTGSSKDPIFPPNVNAFYMSFMAVIWRRTWITVLVYTKHNDFKITQEVVKRCFQYNIFDDHGIGNRIKPCLSKALRQGNLLPEDYQGNLSAERAIKLYPEAYRISLQNDPETEMNFVREYAKSVLNRDRRNVIAAILEGRAMEKEITGTNKKIIPNSRYSYIRRDKGPCECKLCDMINKHDYDLPLTHTKDPYLNAMAIGLMGIL